MILGEDYKFRDDIKADTVPVEILTEPYKGVTLRYTTVSLKELEDGTAKLMFQYDLYEMGNHTETSLRKDKRFEEFAGLILNTIMIEAIEAEGHDAIRKNDTSEPVEE